MTKQNKLLIYTILSWIFSIALFFVFSLWKEFGTIWKYSKNIFDYIKTAAEFLMTYISAIDYIVLIAFFMFSLILLVFYFTYYKVLLYKVEPNQKSRSSKFAFASYFLTVLGFGCVACGQTLIYSMLYFFLGVFGASLSLQVGYFSLLIGLLFLVVGIRMNLNILNSKVCKLD